LCFLFSQAGWHTKSAVGIAFAAAGQTALSLTADNGEVKLWDVAEEREKQAFPWFSGILVSIPRVILTPWP
jgi:hypothetical protein